MILPLELPDAIAYIADPIVWMSWMTLARILGHPLFERISIFHALNHKAIAREYAKANQETIRRSEFIVRSILAGVYHWSHKKVVYDVNQGLDGEGPSL